MVSGWIVKWLEFGCHRTLSIDILVPASETCRQVLVKFIDLVDFGIVLEQPAYMVTSIYAGCADLVVDRVELCARDWVLLR